MNINITKKEYRVLLDMLSIADWVMHAYAIRQEDFHHEHEELKNKLLSYYKEMGAEDLIESSKELNGFYETNDYESLVIDEFIQPYEDAFFWDELIERLGKRDLLKACGKDQFTKMEIIERLGKIEEMKEQYQIEFENHGIDNLEIKKANA